MLNKAELPVDMMAVKRIGGALSSSTSGQQSEAAMVPALPWSPALLILHTVQSVPKAK